MEIYAEEIYVMQMLFKFEQEHICVLTIPVPIPDEQKKIKGLKGVHKTF